MLTIVKDIELTGVQLHEVRLQTGKKGEPVAQVMHHHRYQFELDDPYPVAFWQHRKDKALVVFGEYEDDYVDDEDGPKRTVRRFVIRSVLDLSRD
jgi:hypothetical protein